MPPAIIAAAVTGAAAVGSAAINKSAAKTATKAANYAADRNAEVNERIYNQTRADLAPATGVLAPSLAALTQRLGLTPIPANGARPATQPATNPNAYSALPGQRPQAAPAAPQAAPLPFAPNGATPPPAMPYNAQDAKTRPEPQSVQANAADTFSTSPQAAPTSAPAAAGGGTDYARIAQERPDVVAEYQKLAASADPNSPWFAQHGLDRGQEGFIDYWLQNKPAEDTYSAPQVGAPQTAAPAADPNAPPPEYFSESYAARPDALQVPDYARPEAMQRGPAMQFQDYGSGPQFSWDPSQIAKDPGFIFETGETTKGVNAGAAARGKLRSGDAVKALQDRLFGVAHTYGNDYFSRAMQGYSANRNAFESNRGYGTDLTKYQQNRGDNIFSEDRAFADDAFVNDRSYGTNLWNTVQNRNDNVFADDRNFAANRNDQATANLFNLTNVGANAAAGTAQAGQNYANGVTNSNNQRASATGNAALINGQNMTNLFASGANALGSYYGARRV